MRMYVGVCVEKFTSFEIHGVEPEKDFMMGHDVALFLYLAIGAIRMPCLECHIVFLFA